MKTAQELYKISQTKAPEIVANILDGVREHVIQKCEERANSGATNYTIYLRDSLYFTKELLLRECIKLVKEFEDKGYKVSIEDDGNGYYVNLVISFSWCDREIEYDKNFIRHKTPLYTTDGGIITD